MSGKIIIWALVVGGIYIAYRKASKIVAEMDRIDQEQTAELEKMDQTEATNEETEE